MKQIIIIAQSVPFAFFLAINKIASLYLNFLGLFLNLHPKILANKKAWWLDKLGKIGCPVKKPVA